MKKELVEKVKTGESREGGKVLESVNLCPDMKGRLRPLPLPRVIGEGRRRVVLSHVMHDGRPWHFFVANERGAAGYAVYSYNAGEWRNIGVMSRQAQCALSLNDSEIAISDGASMTIFAFDGRRWAQGEEDSGGQCDVLMGVSHGKVSVQSGEFSLKTQGDRTPELTESAESDLGKRLGEMYAQMCGQASTSGLWLQPMVMMVRVVNKMGREIYKGIPRVVTPEGWQCVEAITANVTVGDGSVTVGDLRAEATGYYAEVGFASDLGEDAAAVEVIASRQIHPVDVKGASASRLTVHSSGSKLSVAMPGATYDFGQHIGEWGYALMQSVAQLDNSGEVVARIDARQFDGGRRVAVKAAPWIYSTATAVNENSNVKKGEESVAGQINGGARWGARHCAKSGNVIVYGDVSVGMPQPPHPLQIAGKLNGYAGEWQAATVMKTATGETTVRQCEGSGPWPGSIAAMSSCGWSGATELGMYVELEDGRVFKTEVGLTQSAGGESIAIYQDNALKGRELVETDEQLPAERRAESVRHHATVVSALSGSPMEISGSGECGYGINALCRSVKGRDSWEVGRARFYIFGPQGVSAMTVSANGVQFGFTGISDVIVGDESCVVQTPVGVYAAAEGKLWCFRGTGARIAEHDFGGHELGWCGGTEQLWSADLRGNAEVRKLSDDGSVAWRSRLPLPFAPKNMSGSAEGMFIDGGDVSVLLDNDAEPSGGRIVIETEVEAAKGLLADRVGLMMSSSRFDGTLGVYARGTAEGSKGRVVTELKISGVVNRPFWWRLLCGWQYRYVIRLEGEASADTAIEGMEMMWRERRGRR